MAIVSTESAVSPANPLDIVEELVAANEWHFERSGDDEMVVEISGRWGEHRLFFVWQADLSAVYFSCMMDVRIPSHKKGPIAELLAIVNEKLWLGHFDLATEDMIPMFRYTVLLRGAAGATVEQLEDLVDIALNECERFYPAFQFVLWGGRSPTEAVQAAILETVGEA
jgi:hypothetical protein